MEDMEKKFELRPLESGDIFLMTSIISKVGVKRIMNCFKGIDADSDEKDAESIGESVFYNIADVVLERLEYCEDAICRLLSRLSGMTMADIKKMDAVLYLEMFMSVVKSPEFTDFFTRAYELLKRTM